MMRLYSGCGTRRLTSTTMVFCILVEPTWPIFSFLNPCVTSSSAILFLRSLQLPLPQNRIHARAVFFHDADLLQPVQLTDGHLKLKTKHLLVHFTQLLAYFVIVE